MPEFSLKRTTGPVAEPLTQAELKAHLRIDADETADDDRLVEILQAAREMVESDTRVSLMPQTWTMKRDAFDSPFWLPNGPVVAVSSISYLDAAGSTQTVDPANYTVDTFENPAVIRLSYNGAWPVHRGDERGITIVYTAGFASAAAVPARFKQAILLKAESLYDGEAVAGSVTPILSAYQNLVRTLKTGVYP